MIASRSSVLFLLLAVCAYCPGQLGNAGRWDHPPSAEELAKWQRASEACKRGRELLKEGRIEEAITAIREAIAIEDTIPSFISSGRYELAKALTLAGRVDDALAAYKSAFRWDPKRRELDSNGPPFIFLGMDYAILLAKSGKAEEAKAVYYSTLRRLKDNKRGPQEPFPFLVVFDDDPAMTVWDYSSERLITAATMVKAPDMNTEARTLTMQVREREPSWIVPAMHLLTGKWDQDLQQALLLATNEEERNWVRTYIDALAAVEGHEKYLKFKEISMQMAAVGYARRQASVALQDARAWLEQNYSRVALPSAQSPTGGGNPTFSIVSGANGFSRQ